MHLLWLPFLVFALNSCGPAIPDNADGVFMCDGNRHAYFVERYAYNNPWYTVKRTPSADKLCTPSELQAPERIP